MGLQANLGFCYTIKQNLQLAIDYVTVYNNYEITKAKIEYYEIDGVSHLHKLENINIEINKGNTKLNHSHYGINLGIKYVFLIITANTNSNQHKLRSLFISSI